MDLQSALLEVASRYPGAFRERFAHHPVARLVRFQVPEVVRSIIGYPARYLVEGSAGKGNWARVPWVAIFDRLITETAREGYYVVYLFREDLGGVYLSLNQGVTTVRNIYGAQAKKALRVRAADLAARVQEPDSTWETGPIDLAPGSNSALASFYQEGSIFSKYYDFDSLPRETELSNDLLKLMDAYLGLAAAQITPASKVEIEPEEAGLEFEDLRRVREHKRIERNPRLVRLAKKHHGDRCQTCGLRFNETYGEIGDGFIEAHHLVPLAELTKGARIALDPVADFAVLCANCHRMIHRTADPGDLEKFRRRHLGLE